MDKNNEISKQDQHKNRGKRWKWENLNLMSIKLQKNKKHSTYLNTMQLENHILSFAQITEKAALACYPLIGRGDSMGADQQAVSAIREAFNQLPMDIQIVIGEGERDQAPRLYTGEKLGDKNSSLKVDVAVDPLEGTTLCAEARAGSLSVMAVSERGKLFTAPDIYMKKIACGPKAKNNIDLNAEPKQNIAWTAKALGKSPEDITVGVLNRSRHRELIRQIRETKARIQLLGDGDVALALETALSHSPIDLLMGTGGAPEGVLAASALKCFGGGFQGQLLYKNEEERQRAKQAGVPVLDKVWTRDELVSGEVVFFATGVTSGSLLKGVKKDSDSYCTQTLILTLKGKQELNNTYLKKQKG